MQSGCTLDGLPESDTQAEGLHVHRNIEASTRHLKNTAGRQHQKFGYLKAVWPDLLGPFLRALPGPQGRPDLKNAPKQIRPDCLQVTRKHRR